MPTIKFFLRDPYLPSGKPKTEECRLYISLIESRSLRTKIKTPFSLRPKDWNADKQEVRITCPHHNQINKYLVEKRLQIIDAFVHGHGLPFSEVVNQIKGQENTQATVKQVFEEFLRSQQETKNDLTIRKHKAIVHYLVHDDFSLYNLQFFDRFISKMVQQRKVNDTMNKTLGSFKTFFAWAKARGYHTNDIFEKNKIGPSKSPRNEIVALTVEECQALDELLLDPVDDYIRNIFLLSCHSGARISDAKKFKPSQMSADAWRFEAWKTRKNKVAITIPFVGWCEHARKYLEKVNLTSFNLTEPYINRRLKVIASMAQINENVRTTRMSGKNQIVREKPKWQYVSFHTGRRTFISILLNKGMPPATVMKLTGIASIKTMMKYLNTTDQDVLRELGRLS